MVASKACLRPPIPEIYQVADQLHAAVTAHLDGDRATCARLIKQANSPTVRGWLESLWGRNSPYSQPIAAPTRPQLPKDKRVAIRMPTAAQGKALIDRYGYHCSFCGIPLVRKEVRERFRREYPEPAIWGRRNVDQHAEFQTLWLQYDHVMPHAAGGTNALETLVIACAGCNYARMDFTLEEMGLEDPRERPRKMSDWDGLERFR